jgi:LEA14-like dessication related protein
MGVPLSTGIACCARLLLLAAAGTLLFGCAALEQVVERPEVRLTGLRLVSADVRRQQYAIELALFNPNRFALPLRDVDYILELNGQSFARGLTDASTRLPPGESVPLTLTVETDLVGSARHVVDWITRGATNVDYRFRGEVRVDLPGFRSFPFDESGTVALQR